MNADTAAFALGVIAKATSLYLLIIALFFFKKIPAVPKREPVTRFAIIIPARNEQNVVGALVKSLINQDYPRGMFDVYVAPNNCTDDTETAALSAGAGIIRCLRPVTRKGDVLHEAFARLLDDERGYDAFCVIDADNIADPGFLRGLDRALASGAGAVKARQRVKNPSDSWVAGCYDIYFGVCNLFYSRPRAACGLSAKLVGTGFAVSRRVAEKFCGWNTSTLAEDAEFAAQCALAKERIAWAPDALIYDEAPVRFSTSLRQRRRWSSGVMEVARTCFGSLTRGFFRGGGMLCFDMMAFLSIPYMQLLGLLAPAVALLDGGFSPLAVCISLALCYAATAAGAGIVSLLQRSSGKTAFISALMFPLFMASWLPLVFLSLFNRATVWKEIRHGAAKRIEA